MAKFNEASQTNKVVLSVYKQGFNIRQDIYTRIMWCMVWYGEKSYTVHESTHYYKVQNMYHKSSPILDNKFEIA